MRHRLRHDLTAAIKARDHVLALLQAHVDERSLAAAEYEALGRHDVAGRLRAEADVLRQYLDPDQ